MKSYYRDKLSGNHLHKVYQLANETIQNYLQGEIDSVRAHIKPGKQILELGCGYGRILREIASQNCAIVGIDNAPESIALARDYLADTPNTEVCLMSADQLAFPNDQFDLVVCAQNGLSAFAVDPAIVVRQALKVLQPNGMLLCYTYDESLWPARLEWFRRQSAGGLLGPIDEARSTNGVITCQDGFVSSSMNRIQFHELADQCSANVSVQNLPTGSVLATFSPPH